MGSSGSGQFGTYDFDKRGERNSSSGEINNGTIGKQDAEFCPLSIEFMKLEDVATQDYFITFKVVPPPKTLITLSATPVGKRLVIKTAADKGIIVGTVPVAYNYLISCETAGYHYCGEVAVSGLFPIPFVTINLKRK